MQNIRNKSVQGDPISLEECNKIRNEVDGTGKSGILGKFLLV